MVILPKGVSRDLPRSHVAGALCLSVPIHGTGVCKTSQICMITNEVTNFIYSHWRDLLSERPGISSETTVSSTVQKYSANTDQTDWNKSMIKMSYSPVKFLPSPVILNGHIRLWCNSRTNQQRHNSELARSPQLTTLYLP